MNILRQIYYKKLKNLIFMAYCHKYENQMKDEKIKKMANKKLKEILESDFPELKSNDLDIATLKLIVLIKFLLFKIYSQNQSEKLITPPLRRGFKISKHLKSENSIKRNK
ncbi:MAG: hypothetical protein ABIL76_03360 [candidate division WOR-3 bacterium]